MWAFIRLARATRFFLVIFGSYMLQLGLQRLLGRERVRARWRRVHARNARRLYRGFVRLRGVFIKLGQVLSIMGTFLPRAYTRELEQLQDKVPPQRYRRIARSITGALGRPPGEAFATFERESIAAASLAQVHVATTHDGEKVAVKVLYPDVATIIKVDLRVLRWALSVFRWFFPVGQVQRVAEQLEDLLERETDLLHEARCLERMAANFVDDPDTLFPEVHHALSASNVLTMSFMEGVKIWDLEGLAALELDRDQVATKLVKVFYKQLFFDRFFHADPHPGNFFVQRGPAGQPRLVVLDFGAASEVSDALVEGMLTILSGFFARSDDMVIEGIETMGFVDERGDPELLKRTVRRYFAKLLEVQIDDFSKIDLDTATGLVDPQVKQGDLRTLMKTIEYPLGWFFVERACVILFGLSAQLAPRLNTVEVGFPYIMKFIASHRLPPMRRPAA